MSDAVRAGRARILKASADLRAGMWVKVGPLMWHRVGAAAVPAHLSATKGRRAGVRAGAERAADLRHAFIIRGGGVGRADVAVAAFDGGTVLLDLERGEVIRRYGTGPLSEDYLSNRQAFAAYVTTPQFSASADRSSVVERLVDGRHLLAVDVSARVSAIRTLIEQFAALSEALGKPRPGPWDRLGSAVEDLPTASPARERWNRVASRWTEGHLMWVPSAYEATAKNLIVDAHGLPVPIDLGDLSWQPAFLYPVGMIIAGGPPVLDAYAEGEFDNVLARLLSVSGMPWPAGPDGRADLLVVRSAVAALRDQLAGEPGGFRTSFERRWSDICPWTGVVALPR